MDFRFASYNLHGFNNSRSMLEALCNDNNVLFLQEHWLLPNNVNLLNNIDNRFTSYTISGICDMDQFVCNGGHPYGVAAVYGGIRISLPAQYLAVMIIIDVQHLKFKLVTQILFISMFICRLFVTLMHMNVIF